MCVDVSHMVELVHIYTPYTWMPGVREDIIHFTVHITAAYTWMPGVREDIIPHTPGCLVLERISYTAHHCCIHLDAWY